MTYQPSQVVYAQSVGESPTYWPVIQNRDPNPNDINYKISRIWINPTAFSLWYLNNFTALGGNVQANWIPISVSSSLLEFLQGNTGGRIGPNAAFTIDIVGSGNLTVAGNPATSTLTISQSNAFSGSVTTNGLQTQTLATIPTIANTTNTIAGNIAGYATPIGVGVTAGIGGFISATFVSGSVSTSSIDIPDVISHSFLSSTAEFTASGSGLNIIVQVVGDASYNIDWTGNFTLQTAS